MQLISLDYARRCAIDVGEVEVGDYVVQDARTDCVLHCLASLTSAYQYAAEEAEKSEAMIVVRKVVE